MSTSSAKRPRRKIKPNFQRLYLVYIQIKSMAAIVLERGTSEKWSVGWSVSTALLLTCACVRASNEYNI